MELDWTLEPSRGKYGIYLVHDGIHYNALKLRDSRDEGEQNKECVRELPASFHLVVFTVFFLLLCTYDVHHPQR
jgi:hypothetical protein